MARADSASPPSSRRLFSVFSETRWINWVVGIGILAILFGVVYGPVSTRPHGHLSVAMQDCRTIQLAMFQYAQDHNGKYPDGRSSTEIFQKLVDGGYIYDSAIFYLEMPGKTKAVNKHLRSENVAFDVTAPTDGATPDTVPGVFATGYLMEYRPGGAAVPLPDRSRPKACSDGIPISFYGNNAWYKVSRDPSGVVTSVIPTDAELGPGPFVQLTPTGPLSTCAP